MSGGKDRKSDPAQYQLDFSSQIDDKRRRLRQALQRTPGADLRQWTFLLWVCHTENDRGGLVRDYDQLAEWLWCNRATAIRMVNRLADVQLLDVIQTFTRDGAASKNEYRVKWSTVDRITQEAITADFGVAAVRQLHPATTPSHGATTPSHGATTPSHGATSLKEQILTPGSCNPVPVPEAEPRKARLLEGSPRPPRMAAGEDELRIALFEELPELREARSRELVPLPPGELLYGVWKPLTLKTLTQLELLLVWYRKQLGTRRPVGGSTVADFVLAMAAAIHARCFDGKIEKSRVGIFVTTVHLHQWDKVKPYVPRAANALREWEATSLVGLAGAETALVPATEAACT